MLTSFRNVIAVFREQGPASGVQHVLQSTGTLVWFAIEKFARFGSRLTRFGSKKTNRYLRMQKSEYNLMARRWNSKNKNPVVGWWDQHNAFEDYDRFLFRGITTHGSIGLEYGCGPGRNIERFHDRFKRVDGVDISRTNIRKAKRYLGSLGVTNTNLWANNGIEIEKKDEYDVVFSVITLQHIASYSIRFSILTEVYQALKPGGIFTFQMGFGLRSESVGYFDDAFEANATNGGCDVRVEDSKDITDDLVKIGFENIDVVFGEPCQDLHEKWIWVKATKPPKRLNPRFQCP